MGLDAHLMKPVKVPKHLWETTNGTSVRSKPHLATMFEDFIFSKEIVTTERDMAIKMGLSIDELKEQIKFSDAHIKFPIIDKERYIYAIEEEYYCHPHFVGDFGWNICGEVWVLKSDIEILYTLCEENTKNGFKELFLDKFIEGQHYLYID